MRGGGVLIATTGRKGDTMAGTLRIDLDALAESGARLALIRDEFETADTVVAGVSAAIGVARDTQPLRDAVAEFADSWSVRRERIRGKVGYLAEIAQAVGDTLTGTDADLAASLTAPAVPATAASLTAASLTAVAATADSGRGS